MSKSAIIILDWLSGRNSIGTLTARLGDELLHTDKLDLARASARKRFADELLTKCPALDRAAVERELLSEADKLAKSLDPAETIQAPELDISRIVRPELFHTPDVSGLTVPATRIVGGRPSGRWELYLQWHDDGRRERRELEPSIELPDGGRLWIHPQPGEPEPTMRPGWTMKGRAAWLSHANPPDPADVWARICGRLTHYLDFPPDLAAGIVATLSLWVMLTYTYHAWPSVPYLNIGGPQESGKTTMFRVLARLIFRPLESSSMTAACLFRSLHERGGTLLLDEAERLRDSTPDAGELRSILLSGYRRGSPAVRLERVGDGFKRTEFDVFGPKALAAIASLPEALASRCIRIGMFRAATDSPKPRRRLDEDLAAWTELRDDLYATALEHGPMWLALANRADVCPTTFGGRDFELWQPLLALAAWLESCGASGIMDMVRVFAERLIEANRDIAVPAADELLLRLLAEHVLNGTNRTLKAGELLRQARDADSVTFGKWSPKGVANALRRYRIETKKGRGSSGRVYSAVTLDVLQRIERTYSFELGLSSADVPTGTERADSTD